MKNFFLTQRFFSAAAILIGVMLASYAFPLLLPIAKTACIIFGVIIAIDIILLYNRSIKVDIERDTPSVMSLGDENEITLHLLNRSAMPLTAELD